MTFSLQWLSHGCWLIEADGVRIVLDPYLTDNPAAKQSADSLDNISHVVVSHAHFDHTTDVASIVKRCGATLVSNFEIAQWFQKHHDIADVVMMNLGGTHTLPCGTLKMVPAVHSSSFPDGTYGGTPAGYIFTIKDVRVYFACDTAYFGDMKFYAQGVNVAVLPIGDVFTMGMGDCIKAIKRIKPKIVLPAHYDTFPPIKADVKAWAERVSAETGANPVVLEVGETYLI